jgi:hypothetical protein
MAEWVDWATDDGNGKIALLSVYLTVLAALAFVVFVAGLARRIRAAQGEKGALPAVTSTDLGYWPQGFSPPPESRGTTAPSPTSSTRSCPNRPTSTSSSSSSRSATDSPSSAWPLPRLH